MKRAVLCLLIAALSACAGAGLVAPTEADLAQVSGRWPDANLAQLTDGHRTYRARCASCHRPYAPGELAPDAWPEAVADMSERARLSPAEQTAVTRFLVAASLGARGATSQNAASAPAVPPPDSDLNPPETEGPTR